MSIRSNRKDEHLALANKFFANRLNSFDKMHLMRPSLPETSVDDVQIERIIFDKKVAPFYINAMTGGSDQAEKINRDLASLANRYHLAMALGSASIVEKEAEWLDSFVVARKANPDGLIFANVNPLTSVKTAKLVCDELAADALQIHLNVVQEVAMPEGDRDFRWLDKLLAIRQALTCPIIIKEVGQGLDQKSIKRLSKAGFEFFDLAGFGGTNFAQIENARDHRKHDYLENIGLDTVLAALGARDCQVNYFVSGGIRHPLDIVKAYALGGQLAGISGAFLNEYLEHGIDALAEKIADYLEMTKKLLAMYGVEKIADASQIPFYLDQDLAYEYEQIKKHQ
ncbi:MAG: type 2 isopentenyl-diphosphate Delta-isomerase [Lactobacillus sp.]|nr:type 2 isopentenyl-diphosphate Delta-isomerase [Lactobacillus sp.]